ncbi:MAG: uracil-DNA glycosylase [Magnetospiraceae bacterium]
MPDSMPPGDCARCPRLAGFRAQNVASWPDWFNQPVPTFGPNNAGLLIVGLAPGLRGANRTGRPFTGDYAGDLLYPTLDRFGFSKGSYGADPSDGVSLQNARITNAVRCVPPQNKPVGAEIKACNGFLAQEIAQTEGLKVILALGTVAHGAVLSALGYRKSLCKFAHGAVHNLENGLVLVDSYHCSRYNTNTGRLTEDMFHNVFGLIRENLSAG